jgi:hypothetical protein
MHNSKLSSGKECFCKLNKQKIAQADKEVLKRDLCYRNEFEICLMKC